MFQEILKSIVENVEGAIGAIIMGRDGLSVTKYVKEGGDESIDLEGAGVEFSVALNQIRNILYTHTNSPLKEVSVSCENFKFILYPINEEYFILLLMGKEGFEGKGKFYIRINQEKLNKEL